jgi:hypothetical protein
VVKGASLLKKDVVFVGHDVVKCVVKLVCGMTLFEPERQSASLKFVFGNGFGSAFQCEDL